MLLGFFKNGFGGHHHTKVNHIVVVALKHNANDVLADVMHIAFHRRHQDLALGTRIATALFFLFDEGNEVSNGLLHHTR